MTERYETNAQKLPWPQDIGGITAKLQREGCRAIGRMGGIDKHYDVVIGVLRVLAKHAESKLDQQRTLNLDRKAASVKRIENRLAVRDNDVNLQKANIKKDMQHLQNKLTRLEAKPTTGRTPDITIVDNVVSDPVIKADIIKTNTLKVAEPPKAKNLSDAASKQGLGAPKMSS